MKKVKMFDFDDEKVKIDLVNFIAGQDSMYWSMIEENDLTYEEQEDEDIMLNPEFRLHYVGRITNNAMSYFSGYSQCEENQENVFNFILFMIDQMYGKIDEVIWGDYLKEDVEVMPLTNKEKIANNRRINNIK
jgi:hypothetical protein